MIHLFVKPFSVDFARNPGQRVWGELTINEEVIGQIQQVADFVRRNAHIGRIELRGHTAPRALAVVRRGELTAQVPASTRRQLETPGFVILNEDGNKPTRSGEVLGPHPDLGNAELRVTSPAVVFVDATHVHLAYDPSCIGVEYELFEPVPIEDLARALEEATEKNYAMAA